MPEIRFELILREQAVFVSAIRYDLTWVSKYLAAETAGSTIPPLGHLLISNKLAACDGIEPPT